MWISGCLKQMKSLVTPGTMTRDFRNHLLVIPGTQTRDSGNLFAKTRCIFSMFYNGLSIFQIRVTN